MKKVIFILIIIFTLFSFTYARRKALAQFYPPVPLPHPQTGNVFRCSYVGANGPRFNYQQLESLGESIETFKKHSEQIKENFKKFIKEKKDQVSNEINRYNETLENIRNGISETSMPIDYDKQYEENFNSIDEENLL
ncbi:hypothetical protein ACTFIR_007297 [Dictyostelium discoideum]